MAQHSHEIPGHLRRQVLDDYFESGEMPKDLRDRLFVQDFLRTRDRIRRNPEDGHLKRSKRKGT